MSTSDSARLVDLVSHDIRWNIVGSLAEHEALPDQIHALREKIAPLRAELKMLSARYESKGRSPSHFDILRSTLMAKLKEAAREAYNASPEFRMDSKGNDIKIELTDGRADDMAHAREEYRAMVRRAHADHRRMADLGKELGPLYDDLELLRGRKEHLRLRIQMAEALTNAWGRISRLG